MDIDQIIQKLEEIEKYAGWLGVFITIIIVIGFILLWKFLTKSIESKAIVEYNKSLELFKSELQQKISLDLAQQQALISKEITSYKAELDKDLSKLSADLAVNNSRKIEVKNEERKSIIEFLDAYSEYLYGSLEIQIIDYKFQNYEEINDKLFEINKCYIRTNIALNKMKFWSINQELISLGYKLNSALLKLSHFTQFKLGTLRHNLSWEKMNHDSFLRIKDLEQQKEYAEYLAKEDIRIRSENDALYKEYWKDKLELFDTVMQINNEFHSLAKKYLIEIE